MIKHVILTYHHFCHFRFTILKKKLLFLNCDDFDDFLVHLTFKIKLVHFCWLIESKVYLISFMMIIRNLRFFNCVTFEMIY